MVKLDKLTIRVDKIAFFTASTKFAVDIFGYRVDKMVLGVDKLTFRVDKKAIFTESTNFVVDISLNGVDKFETGVDKSCFESVSPPLKLAQRP
ncbi:hypothetical protein [Piscibacillus sp. B03]|uniref:hypothetical protein n=1 Tax=Piscibacillus sp. B03 TaxID=3457430 RepID=UPI003FCDADE7